MSKYRNQSPVFLTVHLDENNKQTFSPTRMEKQTVDGVEKEVIITNPILREGFARNRAARRLVAASNRKKPIHKQSKRRA